MTQDIFIDRYRLIEIDLIMKGTGATVVTARIKAVDYVTNVHCR